MRRAPCGMRFKRYRLAAIDYVVIGAFGASPPKAA